MKRYSVCMSACDYGAEKDVWDTSNVYSEGKMGLGEEHQRVGLGIENSFRLVLVLCISDLSYLGGSSRRLP